MNFLPEDSCLVLLCLLAHHFLLKIREVNCCLLFVMFTKCFVFYLLRCKRFAENVDLIIRGHCDHRTISIRWGSHQDFITVPCHVVNWLVMNIAYHSKGFWLVCCINYDLVSCCNSKHDSIWQVEKWNLVWFSPWLFEKEWIELDAGGPSFKTRQHEGRLTQLVL